MSWQSWDWFVLDGTSIQLHGEEDHLEMEERHWVHTQHKLLLHNSEFITCSLQDYKGLEKKTREDCRRLSARFAHLLYAPRIGASPMYFLMLVIEPPPPILPTGTPLV